MTIIAWDGKYIAADRQATRNDMRLKTTKLHRQPSGEVIGYTGSLDYGVALMQWYIDGADPAKWPDFQKDHENWSRLIVAKLSNRIFIYERAPVAFPVEDKFQAWGSGTDYAIAAMALGKSAMEAVELTSRFAVCCGLGVDWFEVGNG